MVVVVLRSSRCHFNPGYALVVFLLQQRETDVRKAVREISASCILGVDASLDSRVKRRQQVGKPETNHRALYRLIRAVRVVVF